MRRFSLIVCLTMSILMASGCAGKFTSQEYIREDVDLSAVSRIAVLPFSNNTAAPFIHERVRNIAITQVLALGVADVVDRGVVDSVMADEVIDPKAQIDVTTLKRLGQRLNVQAFLLGSIDMTGEANRNTGSFPKLAVTLRLVDAQASIIIWQSSGSWNSETVIGRIFGNKPIDDFKVSLELLHEMLQGLGNL